MQYRKLTRASLRNPCSQSRRPHAWRPSASNSSPARTPWKVLRDLSLDFTLAATGAAADITVTQVT